MIRPVHKLIVCMALLALALPAAAQASPEAVVLDCAKDGKLDKKYSNSDLQKAQNNLPADQDEYSDCREIIGAALTAGSDKGKGRGANGKGGSGASAATARKREDAAKANDAAALDQLAKKGHKPHMNVGGTDVKPGDNGLFNLSSATNDLPLPLLLAIIAATLLAIVGGLFVLKRRAPELANRIPLLSKINLPRVRLPRLLRR